MTVVIDPASGATVTIFDDADNAIRSFTKSDSVTVAPGPYSWEANAAEGFVISGSSSGEFLAAECSPSPLGSIGDFVWYDGVEPDVDGIQGSGEPGIAGVIVNLYDGTGTTKLDSVVTDADGKYLFTELAAGTYVVEFVIPDGLGGDPDFGGLTIVGKGTIETGSDADRTTGRTGVITLAAGQNDLTWDAGVVRPAVLSTTGTRPPTTETLPFTGSSGTGAVGIGAALLLLGGLAALAFRKKEDAIVETGVVSRLDWYHP
ncbi:MAG: LPXTG cell wall anchor domain-containing protein [Gammaproteobacteria bacterium]|nr:LPXTG cell wall anchor domain-containing protein [Gammaproteobacteria bacterium]